MSESKESQVADKVSYEAEVNHVDDKSDDVAAAFLAGIAGRPDGADLLTDYTPREEKLLLRKIDLIVMTLLQFALMMGSVDKVSIGTAAVLGMRTDTGLVGQEYSWTSAIIYFGAIGAIFPQMYILQRLPAAKWMCFNVSCWGIITMCMAGCTNYAGLLVARFILGVFEAVIFAGMGLILSMWWTRSEQPFRTAVIFSTLSSVMNGILGTACVYYRTGHGLKQWQLLFILVGAITLLWSILLWAFLPNNPTEARWLTLRQKVIAVRRMQKNHTGMENKQFKFYQVKEAFLDPKTWFVFLINACINIPNGGLVTFNSIIVNSLGFTTLQTTLLGIPTGIFSWIPALFFGWLAVKTKQRSVCGMLSCVIPLIGTILLRVIPRTNKAGSLVSLYLVYMYWGPYILNMGSMYANTGGYTKKMTVFAIAYMGYSAGNIAGPSTFISTQAPTYTGGVVAMLVCYCASIVLFFVYRFYLVSLNKKKAIALAEHQASGVAKHDELLSEWQDETDFENIHFVYEI